MSTRDNIGVISKSITETFGMQVKQVRESQGLTRKQLCQKAMITEKWLASLENGKLPNTSFYIIAAVSIGLDHYEWNLFPINRL